MSNPRQRLKVLISAYACEPWKGSEPEVGWQTSLHMAPLHEVTVVTRANNRGPIERGLMEIPGPRPDFLYYDLPKPFLMLKKAGILGVPAYYFLWQLGVRIALRRELRRYDLIHHSTFNSFRQPGFWWFTGRPVVLGPLGGGQICPWLHLPWFRASMFTEILRSLSVKFSFLLPQIFLSFCYARRILVANGDTLRVLPWFFQKKVVFMLETAVQRSQVVEPRPIEQKQRVNVLWIGRLDKRKGCEIALLAFAFALKSNANLQMTIIGKGPEKKRLNEMVRKLGLQGNVTLIDSVPKQQVAALMRDHDIFLFTSMRDTSGNVILEAMAACLPVITLNHQGAASITSAETAVRLPLGNVVNVIGRVAAAINLLARAPVLRHEMGCAGRLRILECYTWELFAENMDRIYREAVSESASVVRSGDPGNP